MNLRLYILTLLVAGSALAARASDGAASFTLDLPVNANAATPAWLGAPVTGGGSFATLSLPITPPDPNASLLVTVFFQEQTGGFLRISWQANSTVAAESDNDQALPGPGEAALSFVFTDNFYEGIGMNNQRSLLIPAPAMKQAGSLCFQAGSATLGITRIEMEWLESSEGLSSPAINDLLVTTADGQTRLAGELAGQPALAQDPAWHGAIVNVPVTDVPLRIEQGLDFTVQIDSVPALARIALKEDGLPWGQHLVVWINNQRAGLIIPATPALASGGYPSPTAATYAGWRAGTFFVPTTTLLKGANTLQFTAEPDASTDAPTDPNATPAPLAVKDVVLQLAYPNAAPASSSNVAATSTAATPASTSTSATLAGTTSSTPNP